MAATKVKDKTQDEFGKEVNEMVKSREFLNQRGEFSSILQTYAEKSKKTENDGWDLLTRKIVEVLPRYLTDGMITCSLERISQEGPCRSAAENGVEELTLTPGDNFPKITFPTFYPYLDFILRAGPVDIFHMKTNFKVEGSMKLDSAKIMFNGKKIRNVTGTIMVSAIIYLCKGNFAVKIHTIEKEIEVA